MLRNKDIHNTWLSNVAERYNWSLGTQIILSQNHIVTWLDLCSEKKRLGRQGTCPSQQSCYITILSKKYYRQPRFTNNE